jgi:hypothetical protein
VYHSCWCRRRVGLSVTRGLGAMLRAVQQCWAAARQRSTRALCRISWWVQRLLTCAEAGVASQPTTPRSLEGIAVLGPSRSCGSSPMTTSRACANKESCSRCDGMLERGAGALQRSRGNRLLTCSCGEERYLVSHRLCTGLPTGPGPRHQPTHPFYTRRYLGSRVGCGTIQAAPTSVRKRSCDPTIHDRD